MSFELQELLVWTHKPEDTKDDYDRYFRRPEGTDPQIKDIVPLFLTNADPASEGAIVNGITFTHGLPDIVQIEAKVLHEEIATAFHSRRSKPKLCQGGFPQESLPGFYRTDRVQIELVKIAQQLSAEQTSKLTRMLMRRVETMNRVFTTQQINKMGELAGVLYKSNTPPGGGVPLTIELPARAVPFEFIPDDERGGQPSATLKVANLMDRTKLNAELGAVETAPFDNLMAVPSETPPIKYKSDWRNCKDSFKIRTLGPQSPTEASPIDVWISTSNKQFPDIEDPETKIRLTHKGGGVYESQSLVLVSDASDAAFQYGSGATAINDGEMDDPTHLVALGSLVSVRRDGEDAICAKALVERRYSLKVNPYFFSNSITQAQATARWRTELKFLRERFAQEQISVESLSANLLVTHGPVATGPGFDGLANVIPGAKSLKEQGNLMLEYVHPESKNVLPICFIKFTADTRGQTVTKGTYDDYTDRLLGNLDAVCFVDLFPGGISSDPAVPNAYTCAHEVLHALLDAEHNWAPGDFMNVNNEYSMQHGYDQYHLTFHPRVDNFFNLWRAQETGSTSFTGFKRISRGHSLDLHAKILTENHFTGAKRESYGPLQKISNSPKEARFYEKPELE